jgi:hypothetical protein
MLNWLSTGTVSPLPNIQSKLKFLNVIRFQEMPSAAKHVGHI